VVGDFFAKWVAKSLDRFLAQEKSSSTLIGYFLGIFLQKHLAILFHRPVKEHNDICLIQVLEPFDLDGRTVGTVPPARDSDCNVGTKCVISGYGLIKVRILFAIGLKFSKVTFKVDEILVD
jgi:hypothetical protein